MDNDDERMRERAYLLWEQAGRPEGRSLEFWFAAVRELQEEAAAGLPSQRMVEQGVLDADPESVAFRSAADAPPE